MHVPGCISHISHLCASPRTWSTYCVQRTLRGPPEVDGGESSSFLLALRFSGANNGSLQVGRPRCTAPFWGWGQSPEQLSRDMSSNLAEHHTALLPCSGEGRPHWSSLQLLSVSQEGRAATRGRNTRGQMSESLVAPQTLFHPGS